MNAVDLYSGAGGMSLGFKRSFFQILSAYEIDKRHCDTYKGNFPMVNVYNKEVGLITAQEIYENIDNQPIDVVFGGPPCQGFSNGGKQIINDIRNNQIIHFANLIGELQPRAFVMENVLGLLNPKFKFILDNFTSIMKGKNYQNLHCFKLNAAEFNVPQSRKRVFFVGFRSDVSSKKIKITHVHLDKELQSPSVKDALYDMRGINFEPNTFDIFEGKLKKPSPYSELLRKQVVEEHCHSYFREEVNGLSGCMTTKHSKEVIQRFKNTAQNNVEPISRYKRLAWTGKAPTLRAGTIRGRGQFMAPRPIHPIYDRCITTREAARLHSFPDWFQFHPTKWYGMMQIGNSVPPFLSQAVGSAIYQHLN